MLEAAFETARYGGEADSGGLLAVLLGGLKALVYSGASHKSALTDYLHKLADICGYGLRGDGISLSAIICHLQNKLQVKFNSVINGIKTLD